MQPIVNDSLISSPDHSSSTYLGNSNLSPAPPPTSTKHGSLSRSAPSAAPLPRSGREDVQALSICPGKWMELFLSAQAIGERDLATRPGLTILFPTVSDSLQAAMPPLTSSIFSGYAVSPASARVIAAVGAARQAGSMILTTACRMERNIYPGITNDTASSPAISYSLLGLPCGSRILACRCISDFVLA